MPLKGDNGSEGKVFIAMYHFRSRQPNTLTFNEGDTITGKFRVFLTIFNCIHSRCFLLYSHTPLNARSSL